MNAAVIGLMTTDLPAPSASPHVLNRTWELLAGAGLEEQVAVLFFHPHHLHQGTRTVTGYVYSEKGWHWRRHPLPSVVVDNVFVHVARRDAAYARSKRAMQAFGTVVLNPRLPDKWGVWQALLRAPALRPHLPATARLRSFRELDEWLARWNDLFLKPVRGSGGHGVLRVERMNDGSCRVSDGSRELLCTRSRLHSLLRPRLQREKHLIQQGLSLLEIDGSKIDLRVVLHRDGAGDWLPIATVPRMGQRGQAVTNLAQGGRVRSLEWLEEERMKRNFPLPDRSEIEKVAVLTAEAVTKIRPTLAFLGIDIALDQAGRLWTLDINPRPGRQVLSSANRLAAFRCLISFARRLGGTPPDVVV